VATGAGTIAGTAPLSDGRNWVLAGTKSVKVIAQVDLSEGKQVKVAPVNAAATSITTSARGRVVLGIANGKIGALELHDRTTGALLSTIPMPFPVMDVAAGRTGTLYALGVTPSQASVTLYNQKGSLTEQTISVARDAIAVAAAPDQSSVFVLLHSGVVDEYATENGKPLATFSLPVRGLDLAQAPSANTLFVLGKTGAKRSVSVIDLGTEAQVASVPAPEHSVAIATGAQGDELYDFVGTPKVGNLQLIKIPGG
jgi:hypothetical protein